MRDGRSSAQEEGYYLQLEEGQVRVAVVCLVLALLHHVVLEDRRCLGVVAVEAIENQVDVLGPLRREVERDTHDVLMPVRRGREGGWSGVVPNFACDYIRGAPATAAPHSPPCMPKVFGCAFL
jgi:hypothetical protein